MLYRDQRLDYKVCLKLLKASQMTGFFRLCAARSEWHELPCAASPGPDAVAHCYAPARQDMKGPAMDCCALLPHS